MKISDLFKKSKPKNKELGITFALDKGYAIYFDLDYDVNVRSYKELWANMKHVTFSNKELTIKTLLRLLKNPIPLNIRGIQSSISACRHLGFDYPEFKVIEKSIKKDYPAASNFNKFHLPGDF